MLLYIDTLISFGVKTCYVMSSRLLELSEIASHNTSQSCWIIIDYNVYDVTSFLEQHPGMLYKDL